MPHVFVSYNRADTDFAELLCSKLKDAGIATWMDSSSLRPGQDWSEKIDDGIRSAFALVVVMSPTAKASEYVTYEWSFAIGAQIPVIPVLVADTPLHPRLGRVQYLDFTQRFRPWDELTKTLAELQTKNP